MKDNNELKFIRYIMLNINIMWILFYIIFMYITVNRICEGYLAYKFLSQSGRLLISPFKGLYLGMFFSLGILLLMMMKEIFKSESLQIIMLIVKIFFCIGAVFVINGSCVSLFLILLADFLVSDCSIALKVAVSCIIAMLYVWIGAQNLFSTNLSLSNYITYYSSSVGEVINGLQTFIPAVTVVLFIFYVMRLMGTQEREYDRISELNDYLDKVNSKLKVANVKLEEYSKEAATMSKLRERNRLAKEIHDTIGHTLTGISASLGACLMLIDISSEDAKKQLKITQDAASQGLKDIRRSVSALKSDDLESKSLLQAIERIVESFNKTKAARVICECNLSESDSFSDDEEDAIYRIVQECLTNSVRHGHASHIEVYVNYINGSVKIRIKDDGIGCKNIEEGFGLAHMKERVALLNGRIKFVSDEGFFVEADIPIRWGRAD